MVESQLAARGIRSRLVLDAFRKVPRHCFVPKTYQREAYQDRPLPIGEEQTISQPYMVAVMLEYAELTARSRVLEIGTGSGYQTAILATVADQVYTIGIVAGVLQPIVVDNRLRNVPAKGIYNWDPGAFFGIYMPDTFWFDDGPQQRSDAVSAGATAGSD